MFLFTTDKLNIAVFGHLIFLTTWTSFVARSGSLRSASPESPLHIVCIRSAALKSVIERRGKYLASPSQTASWHGRFLHKVTISTRA